MWLCKWVKLSAFYILNANLLAIAAVWWSWNSTNANPLFFVLSAAAGYTITLVTPSANLRISTKISCFCFVLGIPPTNNLRWLHNMLLSIMLKKVYCRYIHLQLSTLLQTPSNLPFLISWLFSCFSALLASFWVVYFTNANPRLLPLKSIIKRSS